MYIFIVQVSRCAAFHRRYYEKDALVALVFKVVHSPSTYARISKRERGEATPGSASSAGALAFARVYSGELRAGQSLYNVGRSLTERAARVFRISADQYIETPVSPNGSIVAIAGLTQVILIRNIYVDVDVDVT